MNPLLINLNGWEIPIIVIVILILFGGKKIPEFMKGLGKGINSFKKGLNDLEDDIKANPSENKSSSTEDNK
jgi:sec-independent protein translocase protein TatA